jgi:hypothetical protein
MELSLLLIVIGIVLVIGLVLLILPRLRSSV